MHDRDTGVISVEKFAAEIRAGGFDNEEDFINMYVISCVRSVLVFLIPFLMYFFFCSLTSQPYGVNQQSAKGTTQKTASGCCRARREHGGGYACARNEGALPVWQHRRDVCFAYNRWVCVYALCVCVCVMCE